TLILVSLENSECNCATASLFYSYLTLQLIVRDLQFTTEMTAALLFFYIDHLVNLIRHMNHYRPRFSICQGTPTPGDAACAWSNPFASCICHITHAVMQR
ncbi:hypothetical protein ACJX0J_020745, partial [Zea mays]